MGEVAHMFALPFGQPPPVDALSPDHLTPHLTPLHTSPSPHPLLVARGLTGADLSGCAYILTKQAAQLLREARAFKYAAEGDLALPVYDAAGQLAGWRLWPSPSKVSPSPKRLAALKDCGWQSSGVVWADAMGLDVLRRGAEAEAEVLLIAEGEPDALTLRAWVDVFGVSKLMRGAVGVIGLCGSGAWSPELGARLTQWAEGAGRLRGCVFVMTDRDKAGERYAAQVKASLDASVTAYRTAGKAGRVDLNGLWRAEGGEALWALMEGAAEMPPLPSAEAGRWLWSDDAAGWAEDPSWTARRDRDRARAEASRGRARVAEVDASSPELLERAQAFVEAGLAACLDTLRGLEGAREAALRAIAPIASCVAGGALERGRVESELLAAYVRGDRETQADRRALIRSALNRRVREPRSLNDVAQTLALRDQAKGGASRWKRAEVAPDKRRGASPRLTANDATPQPVAEAVSVGRESAGGGVGAGEGAEVGAVEGAGHGLRVSLPAYKGQPAIEAVEPRPTLSPVEGAEYDLTPLDDGTGWHLCKRWLPPDLFAQLGEAWRTVVLRSPQNTGKTEVLKPLIAAAKAKGQRVLILTHRRALARSLAARLGARCYIDTKGRLKIEPGQALVLSLDSIGRLDTCDIDLVIIDESEQFARHLFGRTVGDKLRSVATDLFSALHYAGRVVWADADAGRLTQRLAELAGRTSGLIHVVNTWRGWGFNLNGSRRVLLLSDHKSAGRLMLESEIVKAAQALRAGETIAVPCTSKKQAQVIARMLSDRGLGEGVLLVTSKTKGRAQVKAFLADPDAHMPRVLIYSPTIGTGFSIDREVRRVFVCGAAIEGFTGPDMVQLMTRCRKQAVPPLVWLEHKTYEDMPQTLDDAQAQVERRLDAVEDHTERTLGDSHMLRSRWRQSVFYSGQKGRGDDAKTFGLFVEVLAETGRTGWNNVACTLEALAERGAEVHMVSGDAGAVDAMRYANKQARASIEAEAIAAVIEADPLPPDADLNALRQDGTPEDHAAVLRHDIEALGLPVTLDTARAAVVHDAPRTGRKLAEVAGHALGGEVAQYLARDTSQTLKTCAPLAYNDTNGRYSELLKGALEAVGLEGVLSEGGAALGEGWSVDLNDTAMLAKGGAYLDTHRDDFKALGVSMPKPKPEKAPKAKTEKQAKAEAERQAKAEAKAKAKAEKAPKAKTEKQAKAEAERQAKAKAKAEAKAKAKAKTKAKVEPWQWREWYMRQLEGLGMLVERPDDLSGHDKKQGKAKAYTLSGAAVVEAWTWAARPFTALVEAAELDAAQWAAAGVR